MNAGRDVEQTDGCGARAAAYVLGALEPDEAQAFREHLAGCAVCRDEVAALRPVADMLPLAAPQLEVPRSLRRRVLAEARRGRPAGAARRTRSTLRRSWTANLRRPSLVAALAGGLALLAAALVVAASPWETTAPRGRVIAASVNAPAAHAVLRLASGRGELIIGSMPAPPHGRIYEVWVRRGDAPPAPTSALFDVTSRGSASVAVPGDLHGVREVLVTAEPRGGSLAPTRPPVIRARLS